VSRRTRATYDCTSCTLSFLTNRRFRLCFIPSIFYPC